MYVHLEEGACQKGTKAYKGGEGVKDVAYLERTYFLKGP
mgnify:CR=1 FL=1